MGGVSEEDYLTGESSTDSDDSSSDSEMEPAMKKFKCEADSSG